MSKKLTLISIVVPVYRSSDSLLELANRAQSVFEGLTDYSYELILVNDSPGVEPTQDALSNLLERGNLVTVIELTRNFGQQPATLCGIEQAKGEYVITMDDDLQHAPEDIPLLLKHRAHDAVFGRFEKRQHGWLDRVTSRIKNRFDQWILGKPKSVRMTPFRLLKAPIAKGLLERSTPFPFIPALLFEITQDVVNVDVGHYPRKHGETTYDFSKRLHLFTNLVINNSSILLRLVGLIGLTTATLAFVAAGFIVARKVLFDIAVMGWPSIMTTLLFLGGLILLTLGIIGEYLVRIIATSERRPTHYIRSIRRAKTRQQ